jgi:hypothetical protein
VEILSHLMVKGMSDEVFGRMTNKGKCSGVCDEVCKCAFCICCTICLKKCQCGKKQKYIWKSSGLGNV